MKIIVRWCAFQMKRYCNRCIQDRSFLIPIDPMSSLVWNCHETQCCIECVKVKRNGSNQLIGWQDGTKSNQSEVKELNLHMNSWIDSWINLFVRVEKLSIPYLLTLLTVMCALNHIISILVFLKLLPSQLIAWWIICREEDKS